MPASASTWPPTGTTITDGMLPPPLPSTLPLPASASTWPPTGTTTTDGMPPPMPASASTWPPTGTTATYGTPPSPAWPPSSGPNSFLASQLIQWQLNTHAIGQAITAPQCSLIAAAGAADAPAVAPQKNPAREMPPWIAERKNNLQQTEQPVESMTGIDALLCFPDNMHGKKLRQWWKKAIGEFMKQELPIPQ